MDIRVGKGLLFDEALKVKCKTLGSKAVVIADEELSDLYAKKVAAFLEADLFLISCQKNWDTFELLIQKLLTQKYGRDTVFLALGGGSITDLVGFTASIYLRGVPVIYLPTTLLSMVDAAIGGKTAIDTPFGKNLIGTFYEPKGIFADLNTLQSLPKQEWRQGRAEIWKMGLIYDPLFLNQDTYGMYSDRKAITKRQSLSENANEGENPMQQKTDSSGCFGIDILNCMKAKQTIVQLDPFEKGVRRILNFGHTIGHALEIIGDLSHGDAVAIGCVAESYLSYLLGYLPREDFEKIKAKIPIEQMQFDRNAFFSLLSSDKKKVNGQTRFVLIDRIGHAVEFNGAYCTEVSFNTLQKSIDFIHGKDPSFPL